MESVKQNVMTKTKPELVIQYTSQYLTICRHQNKTQTENAHITTDNPAIEFVK